MSLTSLGISGIRTHLRSRLVSTAAQMRRVIPDLSTLCIPSTTTSTALHHFQSVGVDTGWSLGLEVRRCVLHVRLGSWGGRTPIIVCSLLDWGRSPGV